VHGVQDAAVHGFQPIAGIGERSGDDYAHGVVQVRRAHLFANIYWLNYGTFRHKNLSEFGNQAAN
jgi:hypothetical protein